MGEPATKVECKGHWTNTPNSGVEFECEYEPSFPCGECVVNGGRGDPRSDDIVLWLQEQDEEGCHEAADEISDLRAEVEKWRQVALECCPEHSLAEREALIESLEDESIGLSCDWGPCMSRAAGVRYHPKHGWLCVCEDHLARNAGEEDE